MNAIAVLEFLSINPVYGGINIRNFAHVELLLLIAMIV